MGFDVDMLLMMQASGREAVGVGHGGRKEVIQHRKFGFCTLTDRHRARRRSPWTVAGSDGA